MLLTVTQMTCDANWIKEVIIVITLSFCKVMATKLLSYSPLLMTSELLRSIASLSSQKVLQAISPRGNRYGGHWGSQVSAQRHVFKMKRAVCESKFWHTRLLTTHGENVPMCPSELRKLAELPAESIPTTREITRPLLGHLPGVTCVPFGKIDVLTLAPWISTPSVNVNEHCLGYSSAVPLLRVILARNHNEAAGSESLIVRHSPPHFVIVSFHLTAAPPMLCVSLTDIMAESSVE